MQLVLGLLTNPYLLTSMSGWAVAQISKMIIHWILTKKLDWRRMFGDGGMPSAHSAMVSSLAIICGLECGVHSAAFGITFIFAMVVCRDAVGVRREAGKQAAVLNELRQAFNDLHKTDVSPETKLTEFVGHTPIQVIAGMCVGIAMAIVMHFVLF